MLSKCPLNPPKHLKPTLLLTFYNPIFLEDFFSFFKQEKVDRYMLVNANCPYSHRDAVSSLSPIYRERRKKLEFYALRHRPGPSGFQQSYGAEGLSCSPQRMVVWIPSSLCCGEK